MTKAQDEQAMNDQLNDLAAKDDAAAAKLQATVVDTRTTAQIAEDDAAIAAGKVPPHGGAPHDVAPVDHRTEAQIKEDDEAIAKGLVPPNGGPPKAKHHSQSLSEMLTALPAGSRVTFTRGIDRQTANLWTVYRGPGINSHGEGRTLARAIRMIGATMGPHPEDSARSHVLLDETGVVIEPEVEPLPNTNSVSVIASPVPVVAPVPVVPADVVVPVPVA